MNEDYKKAYNIITNISNSISKIGDTLSKIEFKELTFEEARNLKKLFNGEFGTFITEDALEQITKEDEDYIDDLDEEDGYNDKDYLDTNFYSDYDDDDDDDF